jgi:predicted DNA-binding antitoxin AbrB/MazE fold protein
MTTTIRAIYRNGVLAPVQPLTLSEGEEVSITVTSTPVDEIERRIRSAKTLAEAFAVIDVTEDKEEEEDDGYDLCAALNANRIAEGRPPLYPNLHQEEKK